VDAGIVFIATAAFTLTFSGSGGGSPSRKNDAAVHAGCRWNLLAALSIHVFSFTGVPPPGMNFAQLELCTFEGKATTMFERQCRAAASRRCQGFSLGLGYAWALVDEDRMGVA